MESDLQKLSVRELVDALDKSTVRVCHDEAPPSEMDTIRDEIIRRGLTIEEAEEQVKQEKSKTSAAVGGLILLGLLALIGAASGE
jgi:hypothetical protein